MDKQKENMDSFIRKVFVIGFFLFFLFVFKSTGYSDSNSLNNSITIENAIEINNVAILVEPVSFPDFDNSLVFCDLVAINIYNSDNYKIICSNNKANHLIKLCKKRFKDIKIYNFDPDQHQARSSLNNKEIPLIS